MLFIIARVGKLGLGSSLVTTHSISLSSLNQQTTYHYRVRSKDASGNEAISADYTFTTKSVSPPQTQFINFQPTSSSIPEGYQKDDGSVYSSTQGYGWDKPLASRERNINSDQRLDTLVGIGSGLIATWNYDIANGNYLISLASGDPSYKQGPQRIEVEGIAVINKATSTYANEFESVVDYPITINDGQLTVKIGGESFGTTNLNYIIIQPQNSSPPDTQKPTTPINLTAQAISSSQINLSWTASTDTGGSGLTGYKIYRCVGSTCAPTTQIATSATNSYPNTGLTASTAYTYAVSAYDAAGNESVQSQAVSATTQAPPDTTPPTGTLSINAGATYLKSTSATLTLSATDSGSGMGAGAQMRFSNDNITWSTAEAYSTSKAWTLSAGDGLKTVYAKYKDTAGNWMTTAVSDTIILDTQAPSAPRNITVR